MDDIALLQPANSIVVTGRSHCRVHLSLDTSSPTVRVRSGKGGKTRLVPVHPELHGALNNALAYGDISQGRIVEAHPTTAWRWVQAAVKRAEELGR